MEPLGRRFYKKITNTDARLFILALLSVIIFDYFLFPLPVLAASEDIEIADHSSETEKYYLVSQETIDNNAFFIIVPDQDDEAIIDPTEDEDTEEPNTQENYLPTNNNKPQSKKENKVHLPTNPEKKIIRTNVSVITAYNSEKSQTDSSPCTTATGFNVCKHGIEDTVAANHLPMGTKIKIPDLFGDRVFVVRDRMNRRYTNRVDVWMKSKKDALQLGKRTAKIEIVD